MAMLLVIREESILASRVLEGGDELLGLFWSGGDEILEVLIIIKELGIPDLFDFEAFGVEALLLEFFLVDLLLLLGVLLLPQPVDHLHRNEPTINNTGDFKYNALQQALRAKFCPTDRRGKERWISMGYDFDGLYFGLCFHSQSSVGVKS